MASPHDGHQCPFCERVHASKYGLAQHLSHDGCAQDYASRVRAAKDRTKPKPAAKRLAVDELQELFKRLERGE